jgi:hypothetical protein
MTRRAVPINRSGSDDLNARVREVVAAAPPLSDEQRVRIRAILSLRRDLSLPLDGLREPSAPAAAAHFQVTATAS